MIIFKQLDKELQISEIQEFNTSLIKAIQLYNKFTTNKNVLHLFYNSGYDFSGFNEIYDCTTYDKVILDFSAADDYLLRFCDIDIVKSKINCKEVIVISKNLFEKPGYIYNDPLMHRIHILDFNLSKDGFKNTFFFLGGHARWHRLAFLDKLLNENKLEQLEWSLRSVETNDKSLLISCIPYEVKDVYHKLKIHSLLPKSLDFDIHDHNIYHNLGDDALSNNPGYVPNISFYRNNIIEIISESVYHFSINPAKKDKEFFIISEKTFKPLSLGFPFIGLLLPKTFETLNNFGFKLFDELIDYSFDSEYDDEKRMQLIINQINIDSIKSKFENNFTTIYEKHLYNKKMFLEFKKLCLSNYEKNII